MRISDWSSDVCSSDLQRRALLQHPLDGLQRHAGAGPGRGIAGRNLAGIGEAGFQARRRLAVEHDHLVAGLGEVVGGRDADHPAAYNDNLHVRIAALPRQSSEEHTSELQSLKRLSYAALRLT